MDLQIRSDHDVDSTFESFGMKLLGADGNEQSPGRLDGRRPRQDAQVMNSASLVFFGVYQIMLGGTGAPEKSAPDKIRKIGKFLHSEAEN